MCLVIADKTIDHLAELFKAWFGEAEHSQCCRFPCRKRMISKHKEIVVISTGKRKKRMRKRMISNHKEILVISHGKRKKRMRKRMISKQDEIVARS